MGRLCRIRRKRRDGRSVLHGARVGGILALVNKGELAAIVHGDEDQIVSIGAAVLRSSNLVSNATLKIYTGAPHGLADTHKDQPNGDLLDFLKT